VNIVRIVPRKSSNRLYFAG